MEQIPNTTVVVETPEQIHQKKASTAMILSIIGLALFVLPGFNLIGLVLSIIGLVKSCKNRTFAKTNAIKEHDMNVAGFVCGLIGVIASGISIVAVFVAIAALGSFIFSAVAAAPYVSDAIEKVVPYINDAIEGTLPATLSVIRAFFAML